jgi:hypothetical protein
MNDMTDYTYCAATELMALQRSWEREAQAIIAAKEGDNAAQARTFLVCDFEYLFRRDAHEAWCYGREPEHDERGRVKSPKIRWPFHTIAAASWTVLRFSPGSDVPEIDAPVVMTLADHGEIEILRAFISALDSVGRNGRMVTWGGEVRDLAVLRHQACRHGLHFPIHLRDTSPYARERIDVCRTVVVQADPVHLDEYSAGAGIPSKPSPPRSIGRLVEAGKWVEVHDHVLADVLTIAVIALRWLSATGEIDCDRERSAMAISDAALAAFPASPFLLRDFKPWARDRLRAAGIGGTVYRAVEMA